MAVRSSLWRKESTHHEHEYGPEFCVDEDDDLYGQTCKTCEHTMTYEKMWLWTQIDYKNYEQNRLVNTLKYEKMGL